MISTLLTSSVKTASLVVGVAVTVATAFNAVLPPAPPLLPVAIEVGQAEDLPALIDALASSDAHDRAMAACRIGRLRGVDVSPARDALVALLGDDAAVESKLCREHENWMDGRERPNSPGREAAIALEDVGAGAVDPVAEVLRNGSPVARENAAFALGLIEDERAIDALASALGDDTEAVRARAAWSLGMIEDAAAVEPLGRALEDRSAEVREQAAWALGMIEDRAGVEGLSRALGDESADVREQAAWGLGMIEDPGGVDALVRALDDEAADVREQAAWGLGMIESSAAVPGLIRALRDEVADVREQSAWALGMIEDASAVDALTQAIEDENADVRKQALWALMRCVDGDDPELDYAALAAKLRKALIGGESG